jgi:hypothetical protein
MSTGAEIVTAQTGPHNSGAAGYLEWFDIVWDRAVDVGTVIEEYRRKRAILGVRPPAVEDQDLAARLYSPPPGASVSVRGADAVRLSMATAYWIEAGKLSRNRGRLVPGNQLDAPRGARVFFGFTAASVSRNHIFGDIQLRFSSSVYGLYSVRFGNNQMDKINLPIPGSAGPDSYDGKILVFTREPKWGIGPERFTLNVISRAALSVRQRSAATSWEGRMNSGRSWGLLF